MSTYGPRAAVGHMPFPGHRTCAEWGRPCSHKHEPAQSFVPQPPTGETEADRLARNADIPLYLAQMVVMRCNAVDCTLAFLRGQSQARDVCALRADIVREALEKGFRVRQIERAINRKCDGYVARARRQQA